jgi:hypothetical protein
MLGQPIDLVIPSNGSLYVLINIRTQQDMTTWTGRCYLYDPADPTVAVATPTVTINATAQTVVLYLVRLDVAELLTGTRRELGLTLLLRPGLDSEVQFVGGKAVIVQGGPAWS